MLKNGLSLLASVVVCASTPAHAQFAEPEAEALYTKNGTGSFGWAVSEMADIDGDGAGEVITSAPGFNGVRGFVVVYSGATGDELFSVVGATAGQFLGYAIADAGDVNGDGFNDVIAGGVGTAQVGGTVAVFSGAPKTLGQEIWRVTAPPSTPLGYAVAGVGGDVNGDGLDDVVVGQPNVSPSFGSGAARILSGADGSTIHELAGTLEPGDFYGRGVAGVGDIDGDGIGDVVVAAQGAGKARAYSGATGLQIHADLLADPGNNNFGQFFTGRCGDVDNDGTPDIYVGDFGHNGGRGRAYVFSGADGSRVLTVEDEGSFDGIGCGRGLLADLNGDGHNDLAVGYYTSGAATFNGGQIRIISGRDGSVLRTLTGTVAGAQLGFDAVGAGDLNGDGVPEIIASAANGNTIHVVAGIDPCPADWDGNGATNAADVGAFLSDYFADLANGTLVTDFDGNGVVNASDVGAFLSAYFAQLGNPQCVAG